MLIPAKALTYGGPRSRIQVQLPNGKILSAIAATPINSPRVAIGFDQQNRAWVWGEVNKVDLQSTSIRKNRPSSQEVIYPFKVVARWTTGGYIAQAGDRPSQQVVAQKVLAFGNRGKAKSDFILLTETATDTYRLKNKEGERNLDFSSPDLLEAFRLNGRFYGDDYYGILLRNEQDWKDSDIITTTTGDSANGTTTSYTPNGGYSRLQTRSTIGTGLWTPPIKNLLSPPIPRDFHGNVSFSYSGVTYTLIGLIPLPPDPLIISGYTGDYTVTPQDRANWQAAIDACVNGRIDTEPTAPQIGGGQSTLGFNQTRISNTQSRRRLLSGSLDFISKTTAINTISDTSIDDKDGQSTVTPIVELIIPSSGSGGYCSAGINNVPFYGAYYEFVRPYNDVFDKTSSKTLTTDDDLFADSYNNSISIDINSFNTIDYTINLVSNTSYISEDYSSYTRTIETTDTRNSINEFTNDIPGLYKGTDELCLYSKIDSQINNYSAVGTTVRSSGGGNFTTTTTTTNGQTESNNNIPIEIKGDIYLANRENNLALARDYFYIRVTNIKNKINLSDLTTPFIFNVTPADRQETFGRFPLYFNYPIKYAVQNVTQSILSNPPQDTTISNNLTLINSYSDEYYLDPNLSHSIELIVFDNDDIYKLSGTASINYQNTAKTFNANLPFFPPVIPGGYGQFSYSEASLSTISVTIQSFQLIKYHALKGINSNTFGHLYSSANCLGLFQKILGANFTLQSGITRTTLYKRKNGQIMMAFSDNTNLTQKKDRYADLYRLENNKFIREGEKKGGYYPVINPNSNTNPNTSFIGYYG